MTKKIGTKTWAVVAAFGLFGCGGGGDDKQVVQQPLDTCAAQAEAGKKAIVRFPYTVTVDGDLSDAAWSDPLVKWNSMTAAANNFGLRFPKAPSSDADLSAQFALVADSTYFYVGVKVKDDSVQNASGANDNDGVEVYVDAGGEHYNGTPADAKVSPSWANPGVDCNDGQYAQTADGKFREALSILNPGISKDNFTSVAKKTADGYSIEFRFPLAMPGCTARPGNIVLEEGSKFGLNIGINDDDEATETCSPHADEATCVADALCKWDGDGKKCKEKDTRQHQLFWSAQSLTNVEKEPYQNSELEGDAYFCGPLKAATK